MMPENCSGRLACRSARRNLGRSHTLPACELHTPTRGQRVATREIMATESSWAKFRRQMVKLEAWKKAPDQVKFPPRERIRIRLRCKLCGRPRAVYRKFGICR